MSTSANHPPLRGVKVTELGTLIAGPSVTSYANAIGMKGQCY